jgi:putative glutamine amidotransferase
VALSLAARMIEAGRPVFGICRGLQELNVLFGGTLAETHFGAHHHPNAKDLGFDQLFDHLHEVELAAGGLLSEGSAAQRILVNSVHEQGIERLGCGLKTEAVSTADDMIEAVSARPCGGEVLAVQWHPEWNVQGCGVSRRFFRLLGAALRGCEPADLELERGRQASR